MMRRTSERRVEVARQEFGHVAERVLPIKKDVRHQGLETDVRSAVLVSAKTRPAGEERPDRAVVIRERVVQTALVRDDSRAPVGREMAAAEMVDLFLRAAVVEHVPTERDGWQNRVLVNDLRLVQLVHSLLPAFAVRAG